MKKFLIYKNEFENQLNKKIKTDKKCEYDWSILNACCNNHDINHEVKPPYSSKSNGGWKKKQNIKEHGKCHFNKLWSTIEFFGFGNDVVSLPYSK